MKCLLLLLIALSCFTISYNSTPGPACSCVEYGVPVCAAYWRADAVFVGQLHDITPPKPESTNSLPTATLHFIVEQPFRGITTATADVQVLSGTSCDETFVKGKRYLIYAEHDAESGQLFSGPCGRTGEAESATDDLDYIRLLRQQGVAESIRGRVVRSRFEPVPNVKIEVRNENKTFETTSDENGHFSVSLAGAGTYTVKVLVPASVVIMAHRQDLLDKLETTDTLTTIEYKVELEKGRCDYRQFDTYPVDLHATAEVSGAVLTASGRPVDKGFLHLQKLGSDSSEFEKIEADGSFKFEGVAAGEYLLVLNPRNELPDENDPPYKRTFYPNAADVNGATKIVVTEGAKLENLTLRVGRAWKARTVSGKVVWQKGGAGAGARVSVHSGGRYVRSVNVDKKGSFSFPVYGDFKYDIQAYVYGEHFGKSDRVAIPDKSTNLTLVLKPE